ncbi:MULTISPECIES: hypothetical protein [Archaeoglobus]|jgi:hypothetical protein|uniref:Uncharacterized protein n=1 Tax=Archaeoglobus fulgidus DSM 8774 TaxID=1344584 RepID=A0A075WKW4_ARCFL|nr:MULTISPECIES: hypothetical protein [Archaeoglobus]AIG98198.1 hypothetical protein AFULGI_00014290 [Archaeoglobus fulgidus DSM 8774]MDI3498619.1 hypothetical protein [Archaeoglobus sp.]
MEIPLSSGNVNTPDVRSSGILYINIYPIVNYPETIKVSAIPYYEEFLPGKWKKRIGDLIYLYGYGIENEFDEIDNSNALFGKIFRKYLLDILSENIATPWQLKELGSTLRLVKEITENYEFSNIIKLQYELIINVHHWQNTNFGIIVDLKINILDRENNQRISYTKIKDKYGESVKKKIWVSVQAFHRHLTPEGKKYATAMRDKFNLLTGLLKEAFGSSEDEKTFSTPDGEIKIVFKPLEIVEVSNNDGI